MPLGSPLIPLPMRLARLVSRCGLMQARCRACATPVEGARTGEDGSADHLCARCARELAAETVARCPVCGTFYAVPGELCETAHLCSDCRRTPPPWDAMAVHGRYAGQLRDMILRFKFTRDIGVLRVLSGLLGQAYARGFDAGRRQAHDFAVPVPLHPSRLRWRGFNQSLELARAMACRHSLHLVPRALTRIRATRPQVELPLRERLTNLRGAFAVTDASLVAGARVVLVDDVATTCATLRETASVLRAAGARSVDVLVLARADR